jgi:hypothetical protein
MPSFTGRECIITAMSEVHYDGGSEAGHKADVSRWPSHISAFGARQTCTAGGFDLPGRD